MDDLDAFFDDVDQHEKAAKEEPQEATDEASAGETKSAQPPPAKRIKVSAASSAPVMNIVAPSVPTVTIAKAPPPPTSNVPVPAAGGEGGEGGEQQPPLPPPLPPNAQPSGKVSAKILSMTYPRRKTSHARDKTPTSHKSDPPRVRLGPTPHWRSGRKTTSGCSWAT